MKRALILVAVIGCGAPEVAMSELNARLALADCTRLVRCGLYDTVDRCLAFQRQHDPVTPSIAAAVAAGLVDYDPVEAAICVDQRAALSCSGADQDVRISDINVMCRGAFRAGRKIGDPCTLDAECATRSCNFDNGPPPPDSCPIGSGVCGEAFHYAGLGESCADHPCAPNLECETGTCYPLLPRGAPCFQPSDCDWGLTCLDDPPGSFVALCEPVPALGDPCGELFGQPTCGPVLGLSCDVTTMTCRPPLAEGDLCDPSPGLDRCLAYLACDPATHTCAPLPRVGASCLALDRCAAGAFCKFLPEGGALCLPLVDDGSPCDAGEGQECASGVCSTAGICVEPPVCT